ncbi:hypothetical protein [Streptomyces sp. NPDC089799]|uniref:hypothetical protein n=1 Tax=Streptomyces sp. NPDC089799 TaxID=3155066 RepID=UPI00343286EE
MRTRILGFATAVLLFTLGGTAAAAPTPPPTVDAQTCEKGGGSVDYDSLKSQWVCTNGKYNGKPIK